MENKFVEALNEAKATKFQVSESRGVPVIQQTQRNLLRKNLLNALGENLKGILEPDSVANVHFTSEGIAVEFENPSIDNTEGNGFISFVIDLKMKDLLYDALVEEEAYETEQAEKAQKAQKAAEAKKAKIAADAAKRATKEAKKA